MLGIVRPGRSFGMILNRDYGQSLVAHAFDTAVVEVYMCDLHLGRKTISLDRKAVIVRSNFDSSMLQVFDRLVAAPMPEFQFKGLAPNRKPEDLMSEANPEDRRFSQQTAE